MYRRGFTILEIIITVTVMGILMLLSVVSLNSSMISGRDDERKNDVDTLAIQLEAFYNSGNNYDSTIGQYPSVDPLNPLTDDVLTTNANEVKLLRNLDVKNLIAPGADETTTSSIIAATNAVQATAGVLPQPTTIQYVYQPIANDGSLCNSVATQNCRKFNMYYRTEVDNVVHMITSRHQ